MTATTPDAEVVVVGSGVAGLATALGLARTRSVVLVTTGRLGGGSTPWAQGGLAAAYAADDSPGLHARDTQSAAAGLADASVVRRVVEESPLRIAELVAAGARLDHDAGGRYLLGREGGHSRHRVLHAGGDASGAEVSRALVAALRATDVHVVEHARVDDVLLAVGPAGPCAAGVRVTTPQSSYDVTARAVVLATGGVGGLFRHSTNPSDVTGVGLGVALRAGAVLSDMEFVQFHPTALRIDGDGHRLPLVTEALRGAGAVLVDGTGRRLMRDVHPLGDLAPRDVVARRLHEVLLGGDGVYLDARSLGAARLCTEFPTVVSACAAAGIDPAIQPIPVTPAQHFLCGGVRTDSWGATDVPGLFAVGEVAATGLHGANRLASNSLVEGLVFGGRAAARLTLDLPPRPVGGRLDALPCPRVAAEAVTSVREIVGAAAGIVRTGEELSVGLDRLRVLATNRERIAGEARRAAESTHHGAAGGCGDHEDGGERGGSGERRVQRGGDADDGAGGERGGGDQWLVATSLLEAARHRTESRGCHFRADHPMTSSAWRRRLTVRLDADGEVTIADVGAELRTA